jgi:hypothetical protein
VPLIVLVLVLVLVVVLVLVLVIVLVVVLRPRRRPRPRSFFGCYARYTRRPSWQTASISNRGRRRGRKGG